MLEMLKKRWTMRLKQIRRICYACGTPSWGLHMPLGPHTAADAGAGAAVASVMMTVVMMVVAIRRRSITGTPPKSVAIDNSSLNSTFGAGAATFTDEGDMGNGSGRSNA